MNNTTQNPAPRPSFTLYLFLLIAPMFTLLVAPAVFGKTFSLEKGQPMPAVTLIGKDGKVRMGKNNAPTLHIVMKSAAKHQDSRSI